MFRQMLENHRKFKAFKRAVETGEVLKAAIYLNAGADKERYLSKKFKLTPLTVACQLGHTEMVEFLLDMGCDPGITCKQGFNSLSYAVLNDKLGVVKILIKHGMHVDIAGKGIQSTPFDIAKMLRLSTVEAYLQSVGGKTLDFSFLDNKKSFHGHFTHYITNTIHHMVYEKVQKARRATL